MWVERIRRGLARLRPERLSLRSRLSLAMGTVLIASIALAITLVVSDSRAAVTDEIRASMAATARSLDALLPLTAQLDRNSAHLAIERWVAAQNTGRHICVVLLRADDTRDCPLKQLPTDVPTWFSRDVGEQLQASRWPLEIAGEPWSLLLQADPADELGEAWEDARGLLQIMVFMAVMANAFIFVLVTRALQPLDAVLSALDDLHRGHYGVRLPAPGVPDLSRLAQGVDRLASRLAHGADENRRLLLKNLEAQEDERRLVARELHDEIGQHVAAIEVAVHVEAGGAPLRPTLARVHDSISQIHRISRRLIKRLRPTALDTLGLGYGLESLVRQFGESHPDVEVSSHVAADCHTLDGRGAIHVYRIVQEALSNVTRHALGCRQVEICVDARPAQDRLILTIADDGHGFDLERHTEGLGLIGIRERAHALGGDVTLHAAPGAGCLLQVWLPMSSVSRVASDTFAEGDDDNPGEAPPTAAIAGAF